VGFATLQYQYSINIFKTVGEMRAIFGIHIAQVYVKYGINIEGIEDDLATILPIEDNETKKMRIKRTVNNWG
jgi:hypothetical protein